MLQPIESGQQVRRDDIVAQCEGAYLCKSPALLAWAQQSEQAAAAIAVECNIQREQEALQAAWEALQAVLSYVEREATAFVKEQGNGN